MFYIGIDIGTTTISGLLIDGSSGREVARRTIKNTAHVPSDVNWARLQSPERIVEICESLIEQFYSSYGTSISGIGLTGQMHGILYVDNKGLSCSNLISWQDERGNTLINDTQTYCQKIYEITGRKAATGFGLASLYFDTVNGMVPAEAFSICTIADYVAMRLTGSIKPLIHISNASSLGLFSLDKKQFEREKIARLGIDVNLLPTVISDECVIGETSDKLPVAIPIGDNQASFLGSVGNDADTLINIGTGSQISRLSHNQENIVGVECRPYVNNEFLLAGASLCGGSSYNILVNLFSEAVRSITGLRPDEKEIIRKMDQAASEISDKKINQLKVDTRFRGTRENPEKRGAILNVGADNFTFGNVCYSFLSGICEELYGFYSKMRSEFRPKFLAISGNAARNSRILREIAQQVFESEVRVPVNAEEAAYGAAMLAIYTVENRKWEDVIKMIKYK